MARGDCLRFRSPLRLGHRSRRQGVRGIPEKTPTRKEALALEPPLQAVSQRDRGSHDKATLLRPDLADAYARSVLRPQWNKVSPRHRTPTRGRSMRGTSSIAPVICCRKRGNSEPKKKPATRTGLTRCLWLHLVSSTFWQY